MKIQCISRGLLYLAVAATLICPALLFAASSKALPQTAEHKKMMHDRLQEAVNELNLSDDQKSKVNNVFSDSKSKRESIMSDSSLTPDQKKEKMKALHQETMTKVNEVLTPDQRTQLKEKLQASKAEHEHPM